MYRYRWFVPSLLLLAFAAARPALAARTVRGTVTDSYGSPVAGALVRAFDSDTGGDDFMGEGRTDASGRYAIGFEGGHWDPFPHNITKWRPDIYVKVFVAVAGQWAEVAKSRVYDDRPHRNDTTINVTVPADALEKRNVRGRVVDTSGRPVQGLLVKAYDSDTDGDDGLLPVRQLPLTDIRTALVKKSRGAGPRSRASPGTYGPHSHAASKRKSGDGYTSQPRSSSGSPGVPF